MASRRSGRAGGGVKVHAGRGHIQPDHRRTNVPQPAKPTGAALAQVVGVLDQLGAVAEEVLDGGGNFFRNGPGNGSQRQARNDVREVRGGELELILDDRVDVGGVAFDDVCAGKSPVQQLHHGGGALEDDQPIRRYAATKQPGGDRARPGSELQHVRVMGTTHQTGDAPGEQRGTGTGGPDGPRVRQQFRAE